MGKGRVYRDRQVRYTDSFSKREVTRLTGYLGHSWQLYFTHPCWVDGATALVLKSERENRSNYFRHELASRRARAAYRLHRATTVRGLSVSCHQSPVLLDRRHLVGAVPLQPAGTPGQRSAAADVPHLRLPDQRHRRRPLRVRPAHGTWGRRGGALRRAVRAAPAVAVGAHRRGRRRQRGAARGPALYHSRQHLAHALRPAHVLPRGALGAGRSGDSTWTPGRCGRSGPSAGSIR